jgi:Arc/MetJ-type ribon-helix-helix transcriptional regulator
MPAATDQQVQQFVNERFRPRAEQIRALLLAMQDDKAVIDDIYEALNQQNPTWTDNRNDGPPHLLSASDVLAYNSYITALIPHIKDAADYSIIQKACVRPV